MLACYRLGMKSKSLLLLPVLLISGARAQEEPGAALSFFEEENAVVTASRRRESAWRSPLAVEVITGQEIRESRASSLGDLLRFRAGLDVLDGRSTDGNRSIVSVRGLPREYVSDLQVLLDGRSVYNPLFGGVYWESLPVQIQDIERIEIVRGPNAALYGSNAGLGVIHIITRRPKAGGVSSELRAGGLGERSAHAAADASLGDWCGRLSASKYAADGYHMPDGSSGNDYLNGGKANLRLERRGALGPDIEAQAGFLDQRLGVPFNTRPSARHRNDFLSVRVSEQKEGGGWELLASRNHARKEEGPFSLQSPTLHMEQYDAEGAVFKEWWGGRLRPTLGFSWRGARLYSEEVFSGRPAQYQRILRTFLHQRLQLSDRLDLIGGASAEDSSTGGLDNNYQAALAFHVSDSHRLRLGYSRAATLPTLFSKAGDFRMSSTLRFVGNPDIVSQHMEEYEAGWDGHWLDRRLRGSATLFNMHLFERPLSATIQPFPTVISYNNSGTADIRGIELQARYAFRRGHWLELNSTAERVTDGARQVAVHQGTPRWKANASAGLLLGKGFSLQAQAGYKGAYTAYSASRGSTVSVGHTVRLDARLSRSVGRMEWYVGGRNLQGGRVEFADGLSVERALFGGASMFFGGSR